MIDDKRVSSVHRRVATALEHCGLSGGRLVVAVSGGPDSLALLYALHHLSGEIGLKLHGAHLDHGLRGQASREDAEFTAGVFQRLGVPSTIESADVESLSRQLGLSLEAAARTVRYDFLCRVALGQNAAGVAVGHTSDDQVETVLMNIVRGAGTTGLRGMERLSYRKLAGGSVAIVRPLLQAPRRDTIAYCAALDLEPRQDETNLSTDPTRNRMRAELIPHLETYNPAIRQAILRLSSSASRDVAHLESEVRKVWDRTVSRRGESLAIDRDLFTGLSAAVQSHLLMRAVEEVVGERADLRHYHVDEMTRLMAGSAGRALDLPWGIRFSVGYTEATLGPDDLDQSWPPPIEGETPLSVPGSTQIPGWRIDAEIFESPPDPRSDTTSASPTAGASDRAGVLGPDGLCVRLSLEATGNRLWVRSRRPGDRFRPLGMSRAKKLQDFMVDARVPRPARDRVPLVVSPDGIAWVAGWRIADWAKLAESGGPELALRMTQESGGAGEG